MELYFGICGIAALSYFILILFYNGICSFLWFWPLLSAVHFLLLALTRVIRRKKRRKEEIRLAPAVFLYTSYGLLMLVLLSTLALIFSHAGTTEERNLDYVIVLGTDLRNNRLTNSLRARLDRALEYHRENPKTVFVLSGGHGDYNTSTEAGVMYFYMIQHEVPQRKLLMEFYSASTQEKVGYSMQTILQDQRELLSGESSYDRGRGIGDDAALYPEDTEVILAEDRPLRIGILTSEWNLYRASCMAERYGVGTTYPIGARSDELMLPHLSVREAAAILKDRLVGNI